VKARKAGLRWIMAGTVNPMTLRLARSGHGPFALVRHVGRKSGRTYETPVVVAPTVDGFVATLTFGPTASWYRNIQAAGHCVIVHHGVEYPSTGSTYSLPRRDEAPTAAPLGSSCSCCGENEFRFLHRASPAAGLAAVTDQRHGGNRPGVCRVVPLPEKSMHIR
jgi:deazaflavin-dependent oxidoreductase (nitroreductase family)